MSSHALHRASCPHSTARPQRRGRCFAGVAPGPFAVDVVDTPLADWDDALQRRFLASYWQRKPLLIRRAVPEAVDSLLDADELAGLACEAPSRIVLHSPGAATPWTLRRGPFSEEELTALPEDGWTLLVNGVDRAVPAVAESLLPLFSWLPAWRVDDVQVSHSPAAGGSVGPHSDSFDVFLLQSEGRKEWRLSADPRYAPSESDAFIPGLEVAVLRDFVPSVTLVLEPGDCLYLPPAVAHHGIALEAGFTYSVGFLAPTRRELGVSWASAMAELDPQAAVRWSDPWLTPAARPGELSAAAIDAALALVKSLPRSRASVAAWFGAHVTQPRGGPDPLPLHETPEWDWVAAQAEEAGEICRHESSRFAYMAAAAAGTGIGGTLFAHGQAMPVLSDAACALAAEIADRRLLSWEAVLACGTSECMESQRVLCTLIGEGLLFVPGPPGEEEEEEEEEPVEMYDLEDEGLESI